MDSWLKACMQPDKDSGPLSIKLPWAPEDAPKSGAALGGNFFHCLGVGTSAASVQR